jgi:hypothetical protein
VHTFTSRRQDHPADGNNKILKGASNDSADSPGDERLEVPYTYFCMVMEYNLFQIATALPKGFRRRIHSIEGVMRR